MSSSQGEKKDSDVEMSDANPLVAMLDPLPSDGTPACVAGFLSFRDKVDRRNAGKGSDTEAHVAFCSNCCPDSRARCPGFTERRISGRSRHLRYSGRLGAALRLVYDTGPDRR
ncbi:hypothetical protein DY000_02015805 [Brassica cretica]|uniref:FLZ-type domain-containing protein n=1 Tax=Brassica cretica TaxID=69181 RepID=A0ABQ7CPB0_BRACR|nr:hypothetical protein DY000_02015805 [Brassica cretica]